MSYNLAERARKLAKLPSLTRNGVATNTGRVTQEQFADFVFAVQTIGSELAEDKLRLEAELRELSDKNHALALQVNQLERKQWAATVKGNVKQVAETLEIAASDTDRLTSAIDAA